MHLRKFLYLLKNSRGVEAVQNFKYGIKKHQVPNVECLIPKIASESRSVRNCSMHGIQMLQIKTKHKFN